MAWVEKRLRGAKVFVQTDDAGQPQSGADNRVEIIYRPGGKPYRAAMKNLQDVPGAALLGDADLKALEQAEKSAASEAEAASPTLPSVRLAKKPPADPEAIHVYTDGACTGNPGPMGIGVVILDATLEKGHRRELSSFLGTGTNNIAELTAIERGLSDLPRHRKVVVYSDSSYAIGVLAQGWRARANQELIAGLRRLLGEFKSVSFIKVAGHAGVVENERCDQLAREAISRRHA